MPAMTAVCRVATGRPAASQASADAARLRAVSRGLLACWCLLASGCHLVYHERNGVVSDAVRTVVREPKVFPLQKNDYLERLRNRWLARRAWTEMRAANPAQEYSNDYCRGFKDGFADYLYEGGTGEPPDLPPRHYWRLGYQTPSGRQAIGEYFDGFRHGAAAGQASGLRQYTTVPSATQFGSFGADPQTTTSDPTTDILESDAPIEPILPPPGVSSQPHTTGPRMAQPPSFREAGPQLRPAKHAAPLPGRIGQ